MLTEKEMQEYIDRAERGELHYEEWPDVTPEPVMVMVRMRPNLVVAIDRKAAHAGKTRSEYVNELIERGLATA